MSRNQYLPERSGANLPVPSLWAPGTSPAPAPAPVIEDIPLDELRLRRLVGDDIRQVIPMRSQIDLSAAMLADPEFVEHEKKKTH